MDGRLSQKQHFIFCESDSASFQSITLLYIQLLLRQCNLFVKQIYFPFKKNPFKNFTPLTMLIVINCKTRSNSFNQK